ncbi:MAG: TonB-dependent siderophore receptor [Cyanobacteria bacterium P01_F01_bin.86]
MVSWAGAITLTLPFPVAAETEPQLSGDSTDSDSETISAPDAAVSLPIAQAEIVEITNVQVEATTDGFTLRLETSSELAAPATSVTGNAAISDIPNAVLQLPDGDEFFASNPAEGISLINVTSLPDNQVRVAITGTDAPPTVDISVGTTGLVVSGIPGDPTIAVPDDDAIQVVVTGAQTDDDYFVPNASAATRTDTPVLDVPASIQVIPRQVLEDQQVIRLEDALSNLSGVVYGSDRAGYDLDFTIRGFDGVPILRDGFRQYSFFGDGFQEIANLERIEVLRGPASILYGEIEPGGVINLVTKQPLAEPFYEAQLQVGNRGFISSSIDFSGPLTEDDRLRYRLNALVRREDIFRDFDTNSRRAFIAPTVSWQISDRTELSIQLEYSDDEGPSDFGLPAVGNRIADVPFDRISVEPGDFVENESFNVGYNFEHRFSDNWQLRNAFRFARRELVDVSTAAFFGDGPLIFRSLIRRDREIQEFSLQTNVVGKFSTGPLDHTLLFGVDLNRSESTDFIVGDFNDVRPLNIFNPVYGTFDDVDIDTLPVGSDSDDDSDRLGIYLQDQIDLLDNLILLAGIRYDTVEQTFTDRPSLFNETTSETVQNDDAWTPRVGLVYQPIPTVSLYGSYSQSFAPNGGTDVDGNPFEPERGEGFEVGVKAEFLDGDLLATLAYFDITKQNVTTGDPNNPFFSVATGEQRSRGVELDLTGEILPGWNVLASYAYTDAEVTQDNTIPVGNRLFNVPEHSASLWTTYEIQSGDLAGLGFGLGFNFVGERSGDLDNTFEVDSYFLTNAAISYRRDNWRAALNIRNLFDVDYIAGNRGSRTAFNEVGDPFTIIGSFSVHF